jgi:glycosyltransferase involved in cell wall biosynthesis
VADAALGLRASVVVPTYRRPALLARCLSALVSQQLSAEAYEVIVVDDGRSEEVRALVATAAARRPGLAVTYLPAGLAGGPAAARNAGWRAARAPVIAFTDDDCIPTRGWLCAGIDAMAGRTQGAYGQLIVPIPEAPTDYQRNVAGLEGAEFPTANCFYRKSALESIGGFDPRFRLAWREDSDVFFGLLEKHLPLVYAPGAIVTHPVRPATWGISVRQQRQNVFNALLYRKHPRLYRERIQSRPPVRYYAVMLALIATLGGALLAHPGMALAGAGAWAMLTLAFSLERLARTSHAPRHVIEMVVTSALIPPLAVFWRLVGAARFKVPFL